jgi:hypothetical protein
MSMFICRARDLAVGPYFVRGILSVSIRFIVDSELRKARGLFLIQFKKQHHFTKRRNYKVSRLVIFSSIFLAFDNIVEENSFAFALSVLLSLIFRNSLQRSLSNTLSLFSFVRSRENFTIICKITRKIQSRTVMAKVAFNKKRNLFTNKLGSNLRTKLIS